MEFPRKLLELIPSQISGLEIKLEEAEAGEAESAKGLFGETVLHSMDAATGRQLAREQRPPEGNGAVAEPQASLARKSMAGGDRERHRPAGRHPAVTQT
jgi:hypothetical protein